DLKPIGLAIILNNQFPVFIGRNTKNTAVRDVGNIKITNSIHDRTFDEGMQVFATFIGFGPVRIGVALAKMIWHGSPHLRITPLWLFVQKKHSVTLLLFQTGTLGSCAPAVDFTCNLL